MKLRMPGDGHQVLARRQGDALHLRGRRTGLRHPVHQEVPLLEVREQGLPEGRDDRQGEHQQQAGAGVHPPRPADDLHQQTGVAPLQATDDGRLASLDRRLPQHDQAQRRRHGQRHHQRGEDGQRVGQRQRLEERPGQPLQEQHRHGRRDDDQRRVDDRAPDLERGVEDHLRRRHATARQPVLSQPSDDVLDVDDGVVHERAQGDDQPRERHRVDRLVLRVEHEQGRRDRQRDGQQADQRHPPLEQEQRPG